MFSTKSAVIYNKCCELGADLGKQLKIIILPTERIRLTIFLGSQIIKHKIDLMVLDGSVDCNNTSYKDSMHNLQGIISTPYSLLLNSELLFASFAVLAYYTDEFPLLELCVKNGARLNYNSFFMKIYQIIKDDPKFIDQKPVLDMLLFSPQPQAWHAVEVQVLYQFMPLTVLQKKSVPVAPIEPADVTTVAAEPANDIMTKAIEAYDSNLCNNFLNNPEMHEAMLKLIGGHLSTITSAKPKKINDKITNFISFLELPAKDIGYIIDNNKMLPIYAITLFAKLPESKEHVKQKHIDSTEQVKPLVKPGVKKKKEQKVKVLLSEELYTKAIKELDFVTLNSLIESDAKFSRHIKEDLQARLKERKVDGAEKFLKKIQLSNSILVDLVVSLDDKAQVFALLRRILNFSHAEYYLYCQKVKFEKLIKFYAGVPDSELLSYPMYNACLKKNAEVDLWAGDEAVVIYQQILTAKPGEDINLGPWPYLVNVFDVDNKTPLMLALDKRLSKATILNIINESYDTIYYSDVDGQNVFHYWAKSIDPTDPGSIARSKDIIKPLWMRFKSIVIKVGSEFARINVQTKQDGDTFLHTLLKHNSPAVTMEMVEELYSIDSTLQFAPAILLKNNAGKTVIDMLEENTEYPIDIFRIFNQKIMNVVFSFFIDDWKQFATYLPIDKPFFNYGPGSIIAELFEKREFNRLVNIIYQRHELRYSLRVQSGKSLRDPALKDQHEAIIAITKKCEKFFGIDEFSMLLDELHATPENSKGALERDYITIMGAINEYLATSNDIDPSVVKLSCSPFFTAIEDVIPLPESRAWKVLKQHLAGVKTLPTKDLATTITRIKARVNDKYKPKCKVGLDHAIISNDLTLVKFLHTQCGAKISAEVIIRAILDTVGTESYEIAEYLFANSVFKQNQELLELLSAGLYDHSVIILAKPNLTLWLNEHGFCITARSTDGLNILQKLFAIATKEKIDMILASLKALLTKTSELPALFLNKDNKGHTALNYLFLAKIKGHLDPGDLCKIFELCFANGVRMLDTGTKDSKDALQQVLLINDPNLMSLCFKYINNEDIAKMLFTRNQNNKCLADIVADPSYEKIIKPELRDLVLAKVNDIMPEQERSSVTPKI